MYNNNSYVFFKYLSVFSSEKMLIYLLKYCFKYPSGLIYEGSSSFNILGNLMTNLFYRGPV
jgi:hypothetical protein